MNESKYINDALTLEIEKLGMLEAIDTIKSKITGSIIPNDVLGQPVFDTIIKYIILISTDLTPDKNAYEFYKSLVISLRNSVKSRTDFRVYHEVLNMFVHHFDKLSIDAVDENNDSATIELNEFMEEQLQNISTTPVYREHNLFNNEFNQYNIDSSIGDMADIVLSGNIISQSWMLFLLKFASSDKFKHYVKRIAQHIES